MKNGKLIIVTICLIIVNRSYGQYGELTYPHTGSILSSAKSTNLNFTGYLMVGAFPSASGTGNDFVIDQADPSGAVTGGGAWHAEYYVEDDPACNSVLNLGYHHGCVGVDIIETNPGGAGSPKYAIAGASNAGVFFALLNSSGAVVGTPRFWRTSASFPPAHRPTIRESATSGVYYICGDFGGQMYAIKVNSAGTISWAWISSATGPFIEARSLIESQNGNDLVVVGRVDEVSYGLAAEAFFMKINPSNGNITTFNCYSD